MLSGKAFGWFVLV